jgi:hypothetical protein
MPCHSDAIGRSRSLRGDTSPRPTSLRRDKPSLVKSRPADTTSHAMSSQARSVHHDYPSRVRPSRCDFPSRSVPTRHAMPFQVKPSRCDFPSQAAPTRPVTSDRANATCRSTSCPSDPNPTNATSRFALHPSDATCWPASHPSNATCQTGLRPAKPSQCDPPIRASPLQHDELSLSHPDPSNATRLVTPSRTEATVRTASHLADTTYPAVPSRPNATFQDPESMKGAR